MGILDRFRKSQDEILPEEVEKYYKSQKRAKVGTAWLLGFLTLAVTLVIALGLFYGVRYAYDQIAGTDNDTAEVTPTDANQPGSSPVAGTNKGSDKDKSKRKPTKRNKQPVSSSPRTGDSLPANGDLPHTGDPGL